MAELGELEFGFVPRQVVADLQDIGNWKSRASAIDNLQRALRDVPDRLAVVRGLPRFVAFLTTLIADPNFKIAISSVQILCDLAGKVGVELEPHLRTVLPTLAEKFVDNKVLVRSATVKAMKALLAVSQVQTAMGHLQAMVQGHASWKVREQLLNAAIMAAVQHARNAADHAAIFRLMALGIEDSKDRVRWVALEGMAVLGRFMGIASLQALIAGSALSDMQRRQIAVRLQLPDLPQVGPDGMVQHLDDGGEGGLGEAVPGLPEAFTAHGTARFRQPPPDPWALNGEPSGGSSASAATHASGGVMSPGLGAASPNARPVALRGLESLIGGESGAAINSPARSAFTERASADVSSRPSWLSGLPATSSMEVANTSDALARLRASQQQQLAYAGHGPGSPAAVAPGIAGLMPGSHQPSAQSYQRSASGRRGGGGVIMNPVQGRADDAHTGLASMRSVTQQAPVGTYIHQGSPDAVGDVYSSTSSPMSPSRVYRSLLSASGQSRYGGRQGFAGAEQAGSLPQSLSCGPGVGVLGERSSITREDPLALVPSGGTHGLGMWLNTQQLELDQSGPARPEAFSPSKGALLANLKKRQIEKRANSAQMATRPAPDEDSPDTRTSSPGPLTPKTSEQGPQSGDVHRYGLTPFARGTGRAHLLGGMDGQLEEASPKQTQVISIGAGGISPSQPLQSAASGAWSAGSYAVASGLDYPPASVPSSPLGFLAARRMRMHSPLPAPASEGDVWSNGSPQARDAVMPGLSESYPLQPALSGQAGYAASPKAAALTRLTPQMRVRSADVQHAQAAATSNVTVRPPGPGPGGSGRLGGAEGGMPPPVAPPPGGMAARGEQAAPGPGVQPFWERGSRPLEELCAADLTPLPDPERAAKQAIACIVAANKADRKTMDWQAQYEALNDARRLVRHHPEAARACLHELVCAVAPVVDQLRSLCVKNTLNLLQEMFAGLGRAMDRELDEVVPLLLKKAGEVSTAGRENWLAIEADRVLAEMCRCCGEQRVIAALASCALHKSMHVRAKVASHMDGLLELSPNLVRILATTAPASLDRLFRCAAGFLDEGALETRVYGKRIIWGVRAGLTNRGEFERLVSLVQPVALAKKVMDVVEASNGPPPPPSRGNGASRSSISSGQEARGYAAPAALGVVNGVLSGGGNGYSISAPVGDGSGAAAAPGISTRVSGTPDSYRLVKMPSWRSRALGAGPSAESSPMKSDGADDGAGQLATRLSQGAMAPADSEVLTKAAAALSSKDFRARIECLSQIQGLATGPLAVASDGQVVAMLDLLTARLNDSNAKVAVAALECLQAVVTCLRDRVTPGLNTLIPALATAMGSSNDKVRGVAAAASDTLLARVNPALLVQHFAHCLTSGLVRGRPLVVERLQQLLIALWPSRPQLVIKHGLPAAFSLMNDARGDSKPAAQALLYTLASLLGPALFDHALGLQPAQQQRVIDAIAAAANSSA